MDLSLIFSTMLAALLGANSAYGEIRADEKYKGFDDFVVNNRTFRWYVGIHGLVCTIIMVAYHSIPNSLSGWIDGDSPWQVALLIGLAGRSLYKMNIPVGSSNLSLSSFLGEVERKFLDKLQSEVDTKVDDLCATFPPGKTRNEVRSILLNKLPPTMSNETKTMLKADLNTSEDNSSLLITYIRRCGVRWAQRVFEKVELDPEPHVRTPTTTPPT